MQQFKHRLTRGSRPINQKELSRNLYKKSLRQRTPKGIKEECMNDNGRVKFGSGNPTSVGIVGCGVVGSATAHVLTKAGNKVSKYDPDKGHEDSLTDCKWIFFCVPTWDFRDGYSILFEAIEHADSEAPSDCTFVVRSTIGPRVVELLKGRFSTREFVYMPEFLRDAHTFDDAMFPDKIVIGTSNHSLGCELVKLFGEVGTRMFRAGRVLVVDPDEASVAKTALNSLALMKVVFANEVYDLCLQLGIDYGKIHSIFELDKNVNERHLDVWHGGHRGAGGKCLPVDSLRMLECMKSRGVKGKTLDEAIKKNNELLKGGQK